jgi:peptidoglycan hydrolase CwlO-like protein
VTPRRQRPRPALAKAIPLVITGLLMATLASAASADTKSELAAAKERLATLQARIADQSAALSQLHSQIAVLTQKVNRAQAEFDRTRTNLERTKASLADAQERFDVVRGRLDARAAEVYVGGPARAMEMVLGATSLSDFTYRLEFANRLQSNDAQLAQEVQRRADGLKQQQAVLSALRAEQAEKLSALTADKRALDQTAAAEQDALAALSASRQEVSVLVQKLAKQLRAEELAAARAAAQGGMPITFGQWAQVFLPRAGASTCRENLVVIVAWEEAEYTAARWNPLATTKDMPGATNFNSHGVKNYASLGQGLDATYGTLILPSRGYEPILSNLRKCADAMTTAKAINASKWCGGCANGTYVMSWVPIVESNYSHYANQKPPGS